MMYSPSITFSDGSCNDILIISSLWLLQIFVKRTELISNYPRLWEIDREPGKGTVEVFADSDYPDQTAPGQDLRCHENANSENTGNNIPVVWSRSS